MKFVVTIMLGLIGWTWFAIAVQADPPPTVTAYQIQRYEGVTEGDRVRLIGICTVESFRYGYIYTVVCDPGGGEWAAIDIYHGAGNRLVAERGQMVEAVGIVHEYYNKTELYCSDETEFPPVALPEYGMVPAPIETNTGMMSSQESLECCVVILRNVEVVSNPDPYRNIRIDDGSGEATLLLRHIDPAPAVGFVYDCLIGHNDYHFGEFKIRPRDENDWVCPTIPTPMLTPTATQAPQCLNHGDVIPDGALTAGDAQISFLIALGMYSPSYAEVCAADCNGDSSVTAGDAQKIFLTALGLSDCTDPISSPTPA